MLVLNSKEAAQQRPQKGDTGLEDEDKYVEISRQQPRKKLDLNYLQNMISSGSSRNSNTYAISDLDGNFHIQNEPNSQLKTMASEMVSIALMTSLEFHVLTTVRTVERVLRARSTVLSIQCSEYI